MGLQILLPRADDRGLEGQDQHPLKPHPFCKLVSRKGLAKAHFAVPEELGVTGGIFRIDGAEIGRGLVHRLPLLRAHGKVAGAVLHVGGAGADGQHRGAHIVHRTAEPLTAHAGDLLAFQHFMYIVVGERAAVRVHGGFPVDDAVGDAAVGPLGGVLLGHTLVHIDGGVAYFQQTSVLGVGVLICVDHGVACGTWGKEVRHRYHSICSFYSSFSSRPFSKDTSDNSLAILPKILLS